MTGAEPYQLSDEIEEMVSAVTRLLQRRVCIARMSRLRWSLVDTSG